MAKQGGVRLRIPPTPLAHLFKAALRGKRPARQASAPGILCSHRCHCRATRWIAWAQIEEKVSRLSAQPTRSARPIGYREYRGRRVRRSLLHRCLTKWVGTAFSWLTAPQSWLQHGGRVGWFVLCWLLVRKRPEHVRLERSPRLVEPRQLSGAKFDLRIGGGARGKREFCSSPLGGANGVGDRRVSATEEKLGAERGGWSGRAFGRWEGKREGQLRRAASHRGARREGGGVEGREGEREGGSRGGKEGERERKKGGNVMIRGSERERKIWGGKREGVGGGILQRERE